jgi:hypothetical protein
MRYVYHDGEQTWYSDGGTATARYVYQKKSRLDVGLGVAPADAKTRESMWQAAKQLSFETEADCARLLAWSVLAPFCGALPWRPAGFLTGASKSGKSTILSAVVTKLALPLFISGDSTSAYIRQETGNDCRPIVIDEAENSTEGEHRRMVDIFSLMRQSTSDNAPLIGKGTMNQRPITFATRNMYLFSAISPGIEKQADAARMFVVDLRRPDNDWPSVKAAIAGAFTPENCAAIRAFTWHNLARIVEAAERVAHVVEDVAGLSSRDAMLEAILWSAHWIVWRDGIPAEAELRRGMERVFEVKGREEAEPDAEILLNRLLTEVVPMFSDYGKRYTLEHFLRAVMQGYDADDTGADLEKYKKTCWQFGLYVLPKTREVAVAIRRPAIAKLLGGTLAYHITLARHGLCTEKSRPVTQDGPTKRCVIFSAGILEGEPPI